MRTVRVEKIADVQIREGFSVRASFSGFVRGANQQIIKLLAWDIFVQFFKMWENMAGKYEFPRATLLCGNLERVCFAVVFCIHIKPKVYLL